MIVAIDGPAGAGKSSVARELARRLAFRFLDTGAMYRTVALAGLRAGCDLADVQALGRLAARLQIEPGDDQIKLDGVDVTEAIRTPEVTAATRFAADNAAVRALLTEQQRRCAEGVNLVTEGRDQGTLVFPQAECKIFLTASPEERARRRWADLQSRGDSLSFEEVLAQQRQRDAGDEQRSLAPLVPALDSVLLVSDGMSPAEVLDQLEAIVRARLPEGFDPPAVDALRADPP
jgi:CMP/dCMP kinase